MALPMEFWGVEVKAGQPLKVVPGEAKILHLSQASLGESKNSKSSDSVPLFVNFDGQKLVLGTLSPDKFPQLAFDLVFEKEFELSHNWKHGSVFFCGYMTVVQEGDDFSEDESDEEDIPLITAENGKGGSEASAKHSTANAIAAKPESSAKPKVRIVEPMKVDGEDSDEDDDEDEEDEDDEEGSDDSEAESDEEDSDEEETPKKAEQGKKRPAESAPKTPVSDKKAKVVASQKTDGKKGGHTATPHPAKHAGKTPANAKQQTPKSDGKISCKSCNKSFNSENALQSHSKAKHGAK
ncbi:histone deacetylase HDT1-like [Punica granatum]|uniref:Histone deacetylase HDT1-like n=1 Tax=Punica granatum TaxID=22663 RepID=A0A6P8E4W6_PUNGR|nr:histone deacetylase HDT1-like [Punica granatum]